MTAIFMVWNDAGLALAADESLSIQDIDSEGKQRTLWTDTVEKILEISNHKIAVAFAGNGTINSIPIMGLLTRWKEQLPCVLPHTQDYVLNFLDFVGNSDLPDTLHYRQSLSSRLFPILNGIKQEFEKDASNIEAVIDNGIKAWEKVEIRNIFGSAFEEFEAKGEVKEESPKQLREDFLRSWKAKDRKPGDISKSLDIITQVFKVSFKTAFEIDWDETITWHSYLKNRLVPYLMNYIDGEPTTRLLFVGYGESDWTPTVIKINLRPFEGSLPRADLDQVTKPKYVWYEDLAQSDQVDTFLGGIAGTYKRELLNFVSQEDKEKFSAKMKDIEKARLERMRSKVRDLSIPKLEFVARSFVEMESLGSFLVEYLPSVGGNIKVISMTR